MSDLPPVMTGDAKPSLGIRVRTRLFRMAFPVWTAISCTYCLPLLLRKNARDIAYAGDLWSRGAMRLLKVICNVTYDIRGEERLAEHSGPFIFVSNHQSVWETAVFLHIREHPAYILKQELLRVPLFGLFLKGLEMIAIDRSAGGKALKSMSRDTKARLEEKRDVILFPEGTRIAAGETVPFQPGAVMLYRLLPEGARMVPVAHNSAAHWSAKRSAILPGTIVLEYGEPLPTDMDKNTLMETLERDIIARRDALMAESAAGINAL